MGRTGAFCLLYAALQELEAGNGIPDLPLLVKKMRQQRKNMLQEKVRRLSQDCPRNFKTHHIYVSDLTDLKLISPSASPAPLKVLL